MEIDQVSRYISIGVGSTVAVLFYGFVGLRYFACKESFVYLHKGDPDF